MIVLRELFLTPIQKSSRERKRCSISGALLLSDSEKYQRTQLFIARQQNAGTIQYTPSILRIILLLFPISFHYSTIVCYVLELAKLYKLSR